MKLKKLLALVLCVAMVFGTMSFTVFAEATVHNVSNDTELAEAIKTAVDGDTIKLAAGEYAGGISVGKEITFEGAIDENGNPTAVFSGNNSGDGYYQYSIYMNKGTIKNIKIVDAWKGIMTEGKGSLTIDNVTIVEAGYGIHIAEAKSAEDTVLIQNCNIDITWANSFAGGEYAIVMKNNVLTAENPYYGEEYGANLVNTFVPNTTIEDNIFGENAKILVRDEAKDGVEIGSNYYADGFENALSEDCAEGVKIETYYADIEMTEVVEAPKGTITPGYTTETRIWGEGTSNSAESFVVELYAGDVKIAQASLKDYEDIIDGDVYVTWGIPFNGEDTEYWDVEWYDSNPVVDIVPTKVVLLADGVTVAENEVQMNAPDNLNPVKWDELEGVPAAARIGKKGYGSLEAAFAAAKSGDTIELISNVTLTEGVSIMDSAVLGDITLDGNGNTVTLNMNGEGTGIRFGGQWATGVKIYDLTIDGSAKYGLWLNGGTSSVIENLTITGDYDDVYGGLILYGTHGATLTNCDIVSGFTNGQDDYPLNLVNTKIGSLTANESEEDEVGAKIFVDEESSIETVVCSGDNSIMIDPASVARIGTVLLATGESWTDTVAPAAEVGGVYYASLDAALNAAKDMSGDVVINLYADVELSYGAREAYGAADTSSITINGNGNKLTLNQTDGDWSSIGMANADGVWKMNNLEIVKTGYGATGGAWNTHTINFDVNAEISNATINNSIAFGGDFAKLTDVDINEDEGFYCVWVKANVTDVQITGGTFTATNDGRGIKVADEYVDEADRKQVKLSVTGTTFETAKKAAVLVSSTTGAAVTASSNDITKVAEDTVNFVWVDEDWADYADKTTLNNNPVVVESEIATAISVSFVEESAGLYNIVLKGNNGDIYEFVGAELTFANTSKTFANEDMNYEILGIDGTTNAEKSIEKADTYALRLVDGAERMTGSELVIGQVKFYGQGDINFTVSEGKVVTTEYGTNLGKYYNTTDNTLVVNGITNGAVEEITRDVVVNVAYNHALDGTYWNDNQITVTVKDGFGNVYGPYSVADGIETIADVKLGRLTVTLEAPGFRKYVYNTTLEAGADENDALVLNFWNEVKRGTAQSPLAEIEAGKVLTNKNFLVGDIVMDYTVDEYDLAAVTSYYGTYEIAQEDAEKYIKYDLNRDGNIDIIDVHYVLHTLNN